MTTACHRRNVCEKVDSRLITVKEVFTLERTKLTNEKKEQIFRKVEESFVEETDLLTRLVKTKSIIGNEMEAQKLYAETCRSLGLSVEIFSPDKKTIKTHPAYTPIDLDYTDRANVIAEYKGAAKGRSLILGGHIDVVSPDPTTQWIPRPMGWGGCRRQIVWKRGSRHEGRPCSQLLCAQSPN